MTCLEITHQSSCLEITFCQHHSLRITLGLVLSPHPSLLWIHGVEKSAKCLIWIFTNFVKNMIFHAQKLQDLFSYDLDDFRGFARNVVKWDILLEFSTTAFLPIVQQFDVLFDFSAKRDKKIFENPFGGFSQSLS